MDETVRDEEIFIISLVERCHYKFSLDSVKHKLPGGDVIIAPHSDPTSSRCNRVNGFEPLPRARGLSGDYRTSIFPVLSDSARTITFTSTSLSSLASQPDIVSSHEPSC